MVSLSTLSLQICDDVLVVRKVFLVPIEGWEVQVRQVWSVSVFCIVRLPGRLIPASLIPRIPVPTILVPWILRPVGPWVLFSFFGLSFWLGCGNSWSHRSLLSNTQGLQRAQQPFHNSVFGFCRQSRLKVQSWWRLL